jgi:poly-gamma-glutamate capsule biosynthesis protein CapA/YwtB (metallophosphatase superfamily)
MSAEPKKLLFAGDLMIGRVVNEMLQRERPEYPWGDTLPLFRKAAWRFCNLECVLADSWDPASVPRKMFHFRSDAKNVAVLQTAGIDAVSLANNHTLDFGERALSEMLDLLDRTGICRSGAGRGIGEACRPAICRAAETTIAVIAFTDNEPEWEAGLTKPGVFHVPVDLDDPRARRLLQIVRTARAVSDLVFVSAHWGPNWGRSPPRGEIPFGHALIDAGADLVFGHSPHVFHGIEIYRDRPIIYSAGDFIDDYAVDPIERNDHSFVFLIETDIRSILRLNLYPTLIRGCQVRIAKSAKAAGIAQKMTERCAAFGTQTRWNHREHCLEIGITRV